MNSIIPYNLKLKEYAKYLRNHSTKAEVLLWKEINQNNLGVSFLRQKPIDEFIVDFYCKELKLVIEIDGEVHKYQMQYDSYRQNILIKKYNLTFLRFTNEEVYFNRFTVVKTIIAEIERLKIERSIK